MEELIQRLDSWLRQNRPDYYKKLLPGLTEQELTDLEKELGVELPADFKTFYRWRNGQAENQFDSLVSNFMWMNIRSVIQSLNGMNEIMAENDFHPYWWRAKWMPFLTNEHDTEYCLDLEGSFTEVKGQILLFLNDDAIREVFHSSFYKWLETVVIALERGLFRGDEDDTRLQEYETYSELEREINPGYPIRHEARFIGN